jgi:hypothetical protein
VKGSFDIRYEMKVYFFGFNNDKPITFTQFPVYQEWEIATIALWYKDLTNVENNLNPQVYTEYNNIFTYEGKNLDITHQLFIDENYIKFKVLNDDVKNLPDEIKAHKKHRNKIKLFREHEIFLIEHKFLTSHVVHENGSITLNFSWMKSYTISSNYLPKALDFFIYMIFYTRKYIKPAPMLTHENKEHIEINNADPLNDNDLVLLDSFEEHLQKPLVVITSKNHIYKFYEDYFLVTSDNKENLLNIAVAEPLKYQNHLFDTKNARKNFNGVYGITFESVCQSGEGIGIRVDYYIGTKKLDNLNICLKNYTKWEITAFISLKFKDKTRVSNKLDMNVYSESRIFSDNEDGNIENLEHSLIMTEKYTLFTVDNLTNVPDFYRKLGNVKSLGGNNTITISHKQLVHVDYEQATKQFGLKFNNNDESRVYYIVGKVDDEFKVFLLELNKQIHKLRADTNTVTLTAE